MSDLGFRLSQALSAGRVDRWKPDTRAEVLFRLLLKRAAAQRAGLVEQEAALRDQIRWSLPMVTTSDAPEE
ncbi:MAG: hypothetical protein ABS87_05540 [Sphingomonas sp. SCN 67-18]|uniref:hypothetical protein n=1 Tax=uncultured Sphingomonas sp. TaxID=158754 RepID=UPI00086CBEF1|nr:hypothetical protein [Sphingomonas sp. SCN 67-18]ODU21569.1 MAG: hypothetical protein ABS87_05540 [Sphingomonas sp. SCN 67-18]